jgi:hypothetical protein
MNSKARVAEHLNGLLFLCGFVAVVASVAQWSGPLAGVLGGGVVMLMAAWPYVRPMRKS